MDDLVPEDSALNLETIEITKCDLKVRDDTMSKAAIAAALTRAEQASLRSHFATSNNGRGGRRCQKPQPKIWCGAGALARDGSC
jgi:hypothetical protein